MEKSACANSSPLQLSASVLAHEGIERGFHGVVDRDAALLGLVRRVRAAAVQVLEELRRDHVVADLGAAGHLAEHHHHDVPTLRLRAEDLQHRGDGGRLRVDHEEQGVGVGLGLVLDRLELRVPVVDLGVEAGHTGRFERRDGQRGAPGRRVAGAAEENVELAHGLSCLSGSRGSAR